MLKTVLHYHS